MSFLHSRMLQKSAQTPAKPVAKPTTSAKPAAKAPSVPGKLRSTGQKVPSLYMD